MVKDILTRLSNAHGISGSEGSITGIVRKELKKYADEIREDRMGNLVAVKKGNNIKVMLAAHAD